MARGTTLALVRKMLKAEIGASLSVGTADDNALNQAIESMQKWYASEYDWPFLSTRADVTCTVGTQYFTLPTTIMFERPVQVTTKYNDSWLDVDSGIGAEEYNIHDIDEPVDPVMRWRITDDGKFEVWPIAVTQQTIRFYGQRVPATLQTNGAFDDTKVVELDDLLIVYACAAYKLLDLKKPSAMAKKDLADKRLRSLRSAAPQPDRCVVLGSAEIAEPSPRVVPITVA